MNLATSLRRNPGTRPALIARGSGAQVLVILVAGSKVSVDGGSLCIAPPEEPMIRVPIATVGGLVVGTGVSVTTPCLAALAGQGGIVVGLESGGTIATVTAPPGGTSAHRLLAQARMECDRKANGEASLRLARELVHSKILAMEELVGQHIRTEDSDAEALSDLRLMMDRAREALPRVASIDEVRGMEGAASAAYFRCFPLMLKSELTSGSRSRRPPRDEVNAMLSFGYTMLLSELAAVVVAHGLQPGLGVLHTPDHRRPSLALDLIEPLRASVIDRLMLRMANRREVQARHFERRDGGVYFTRDGCRTFLEGYQEMMAAAVSLSNGSVVSVRALLDGAVRWYIEQLEAMP